ncbi:MAG: response regulator [bacterium]
MLTEQIILILNSEGKESAHCLNIIEQAFNIRTISADNLEKAAEMIEKYEPDLILAYDNFNKNIIEICLEIRSKKSLYRPVLVVLSNEQSLEKKLEVIRSGADDFQNMSATAEEISLRLFAHLRRNIEELSDTVTKLPVESTVYKIIKRNLELKTDKFMTIMYLDVDNYFPYKEIYGHIAAEKLIQTFIAIIKTSINENDFLGQISENGFIILTASEKAEKIAMFLSYSFDSVAPKFYSNEDTERGYLLLTGDDKIGRRKSFVSVGIGIASNRYGRFHNYQEALTLGKNVKKNAKSRKGSYWAKDKPKVSGRKIIEQGQNKILIAEKDAALAYLLSTTLEMQGYKVEIIDNIEEIIENIEKNKTDLLLLDIAEENSFDELSICSFIKEEYPSTKVLVSTVNRNKERILDSGADLYIPKPYELGTLFNWIDKFLNDEF